MDCGLRSGVGAHSQPGAQGCICSNVDDTAGTTVLQMGQRGLGRVEGGHQVEPVQSLPHLQVALVNGLPGEPSRDVEQHVDPACAITHGSNRLVHLRLIGEVHVGVDHYIAAQSGWHHWRKVDCRHRKAILHCCRY